MSKYIKKIKLQNFKRFKSLTHSFDKGLNVLIGDNEAGKSSILTAIDIVLSGSRHRVENIGLENLFNTEVIDTFLAGDKKIEDLPKLYVELYLNEQHNHELNGKANLLGEESDGLRLICEPRDDLSEEIKHVLAEEGSNFPFEFYAISFKTFEDRSYSGYKKYLRHLLLDNTQINNEYATREYVKKVFASHVDEKEKSKFDNEYRKHKNNFRDVVLKDLNDGIDDYQFSLRTSTKSSLDTDMTISEGNISIENKGKGRQCFIKTTFALQGVKRALDVVLLEEPENHLSHVNMRKLIQEISGSEDKQLFIATHSDLVSARLDLRKAVLLNSNSNTSISLKDLDPSTAKFFMKAPDSNILQFILSSKVILVEGDAEYILSENFFLKEIGKTTEESNVHIISVGGIKFKRYLEIAKLLDIKTAVITDNDGDYKKNITQRYKGFVVDNKSKVFADTNVDRYTFEVAMYQDNQGVCDEIFKPNKNTVQEYMLSNKADCAISLLEKKADEIVTPQYIKDAILWINE